MQPTAHPTRYSAPALLAAAATLLGFLALIGVSPSVLAALGVVLLGVLAVLPARTDEFSGRRWNTNTILGAIAIVLGLLALSGIAPTTLIALGIIALGASVFTFSGGVGIGARTILPAAAVFLGLLALIGVAPLVLIALGVMCLGIYSFV